MSVGTGIGLIEIQFEASTVDGPVFDILSGEITAIVGKHTVIRALDGLMVQARDALYVLVFCFLPSLKIVCRLAYRAGVTTAVVLPQTNDGLLSGLATACSTGAKHKLEPGAVIKNVSGVPVMLSLGSSAASVHRSPL